MKIKRTLQGHVQLKILTLLVFITLNWMLWVSFMLPKNDAEEMINWNSTKSYVLDNNLCQNYNGSKLTAIILVSSKAGNGNQRLAHRQSISQRKLADMGIQRIFTVPIMPHSVDDGVNFSLENEQTLFGDLLRVKVDERNPFAEVYKTVVGLRWAMTLCKKADFVIQTVDDAVYDIFYIKRQLDKFTDKHPELKVSNALLTGKVMQTPVYQIVISNEKQSTVRTSNVTHLKYLSGLLYITNPPTLQRLLTQVVNMEFNQHPDLFVTGILATKLHISLHQINTWYIDEPYIMQCCFNNLQHNIKCDGHVAPANGNVTLIAQYIPTVEKCYSTKCQKICPEKLDCKAWNPSLFQKFLNLFY